MSRFMSVEEGKLSRLWSELFTSALCVCNVYNVCVRRACLFFLNQLQVYDKDFFNISTPGKQWHNSINCQLFTDNVHRISLHAHGFQDLLPGNSGVHPSSVVVHTRH